MNIIARTIGNLAKTCLGRTVEGNSLALARQNFSGLPAANGSILAEARKYLENSMLGLQQIREKNTLLKMHERGPIIKKRKSKNPFNGAPFAKGVVLKTLIKKPKKPNSANRKCVLVRLSNGKEMTAYIPGIGHNLQEHNIVLCRVGRCRDVPGVKIKCVRGKYDLAHVVKNRS
ncbi:40S ribosomal protein S12, mitochondrial [Nasonia vitripennis]|uniref:Small ribosomal subunit protein uS12m n=1 Tax=Nasonia vitripennis TaxID=7425 RepID=A0A7M7IMU4_NASVI|nr:40S ribosomal protein S12, mitochondrial [Nasonia vitripennis]